MSTYGMTEKAHLLSQNPNGQQQQPGKVNGGQHYGQPIQVQGLVHVKWFNHNDDKYKCCCSSVHVKNGAMTFGVLCMIMTLLSLFSLTVYMQFDSRFPDPAYVLPTSIMWAMGLCSLACICILLVGIRTQRSHLLIPFLVLVGVDMLGIFVNLFVVLFQVAFVLVYGLSSRNTHITVDGMNFAQFMNLHATTTVFYITALAIKVWVFSVVYRCLKYFSDMKKMSYCTSVNNV
ncbi:hypothetical protein WR25_27272 [Diploscapter pachys]|uniref:Uncharacterized protein n=1 Tax=Diploscapter pachys TaxID=2018661 RepID=A0A2A2JHU8_9BILA|nr:hypothetical protein WR25_27272 [Diploscapter pachys]